MKLPSFTTIVSTLLLLHLGYLYYSVWKMVQPPVCTNKGSCLKSYLLRKPTLELNIFFSSKKNPLGSEIVHVKSFLLTDYDSIFKSMMNVKIPKLTKINGTLYAHIFLSKAQETLHSGNKYTKLLNDPATVYDLVPMSLNTELGHQNRENGKKSLKTKTYVKAVLPVGMLTEPLYLPSDHIPNDIYQYIRLYKKNQEYLPIFLHNFLQDRTFNATEIEMNTSHVPILLFYEPLSYAKLRIIAQTQLAMVTIPEEFGFKIKNTDGIKEIFDTNYYILLVLIFFAYIRIIFDILATKSDISFWKSRTSMAGLSSCQVIWRAFSHIVVILYLLEENVSSLIIIPIVIRSLIEIWKVFKVIPVDWKNLKFKQLSLNRAELDTKKFDAEFMKYVSYVLYPLCAIAAIYLFINEPQKSWYSWIIKSLVFGTYVFGFLFMLPQLFINYKLKSVEYLPWKTLIYKAFNTFIDDFLAFAILTPSAYRYACFRDDVVFIIYIFQRWWYNVDKCQVDTDVEVLKPYPEEAKIKTD